jgi:peptidoglycan-associated lipoprotein
MKEIVAAAVKRSRVLSLSALALIALSFMLVAGCQQKAATRPETTSPSATKEQPEQAQQKGPEEVTGQKAGTVTSEDMPPGYAEGKEGMFEDVLFDFDKYDVKSSYKPEMQKVAAWMTKNTSATLSIEGHCDDRGTNEYNLALGDRRAKAVKDFLISLGVPSSRIETISYGEEKPLCTEQTEECWAKNRRAHFVILTKAGK